MNMDQSISILESGRKLDELIIRYKQSKSYQEKKELKNQIIDIYTKYKHNMKNFVETINKMNIGEIKLNRPELTIDQLELMVEQLVPEMNSIESVIKIYNNLHKIQSDIPDKQEIFDDGDDLLFE